MSKYHARHFTDLVISQYAQSNHIRLDAIAPDIDKILIRMKENNEMKIKTNLDYIQTVIYYFPDGFKRIDVAI